MKKTDGFTLIEMILVLIIISSIIVMFVGYTTRKGEEFRRDKAVLQMQQVLNAGLAFYVDNGRWPSCGSSGDCKLKANNGDLETKGYLPNIDIVSPWDLKGLQQSPQTYPNFSVCLDLPAGESAMTNATIVAGRLPMAFTSVTSASTTECSPDKIKPDAPCVAGGACTVMATVNIPGQNLNNARSINFAGMYYSGACVPVPTCPGSKMHAEIFVAPTSVSGTNDAGTDPTKIYSISSFMAYATGPSVSGSIQVAECTANPPTNPPAISDCKWNDPNNTPPPVFAKQYWRVCLAVMTEKGVISTYNNNNWTKSSGTIMAITRCVPDQEPTGSDFSVFLNR